MKRPAVVPPDRSFRGHVNRDGSPKQPYPTREKAQAQANIRSVGGVSLNAYKCSLCGKWHIGAAW